MIEAPDRKLRRIGLFCFISWAVFIAAALRLISLSGGQEGYLRLAIAAVGTAVALYAVVRAGAWPRVLYLLTIGYLAYFAAGSSWYALWQVAAVPAEGAAETLAVAFELATRMVLHDLATERYAPALALAYDLVVMPMAQVTVAVYLARALLQR
jgi:hypothetical protein